MLSFRFVTFFFLFGILFSSCTYYFGNSWKKTFNAEQTHAFPSFEKRPKPLSREEKISVGKELLQDWAARELNQWKERGKVNEPRIMIAKLALGKDIDSLNLYIQSLKPYGKSGTHWAFNPKGDYDFCEITMCALIYLFKDHPEKLYPETAKHVMEKLIIENGSKPRTRTPRMSGIMRDTENHILMKEVSRYLKNQWLFEKTENKKNDNTVNGMEQWLMEHLAEMEITGFYEFNANPYLGYTMVPLLTLHAFAKSENLRNQTQRIIDLANWEYALGSYYFRRYPPFRRRLERAAETQLNRDPHTAMARMWFSKYHLQECNPKDIPHNHHQALMALMLPYQLPDEIEAMLRLHSPEYFIKIGHGLRASPEIYSGGKGFLLSAGGVQRGKKSQIAARPTVLMLDDGAKDLKECFHLPGKGKMKKWNNTGVYSRFACSNAPVSVPGNYSPAASKEGWQIFEPDQRERSLKIAVFNGDNFGLLAIFPSRNGSAGELAKELHHFNSDSEKLHGQFVFPQGDTIYYDLASPKNCWVITQVNGELVDRKFDKWSRYSENNTN